MSISLWATVAASVAVTADVAPSGAAMAKGSELRRATKAAPIALAMKVASVKRSGEDQGREGESVGDRNDGRGGAGEEVSRARKYVPGDRVSLDPRPILG